MKDKKVLFMGTPLFATVVLDALIRNTNVVGVVCQNDKIVGRKKVFTKCPVKVMAEEHNIKVYQPINLKQEYKELLQDEPDIIITCAYGKILNEELINYPKYKTINVHASLLPFLRGAAPINWAIRLGYKETGLTAFVLSDKIDHGDIIANTRVKIAAGEKYTTLYKKLSNACVDFTGRVIEDVLQHEDWKDCLIAQPSWNHEYEYIINAHKVNSDYFHCHWSRFDCERMQRMVNSVDNVGLPCIIYVIDEDNKEKKFEAKIYDVEVVNKEETPMNVQTLYCESDGKTFVRLNLADCGKCVYIKRIQLAGKKIMNIEDFLNGFRYFRENKTVIITDLMEADNE